MAGAMAEKGPSGVCVGIILSLPDAHRTLSRRRNTPSGGPLTESCPCPTWKRKHPNAQLELESSC